ncbi:hypothetical protein [Aurantiacibacter spongiae]|uniref:Uncharacterized protein n=1 Tax=Aurantiacibacter spongiae TaxID=2488860 RepID=A0A3N5DR38_9SPHN|nr:hypothetical protein [Aurantiacibacter spongiae]RPF71611.1 hypothetical protein EG799_08245 [Aurantiacibacter spongiae]
MKKTLTTVAAAAAALTAAAAVPAAAQSPSERAQARLAQDLEGRVAGEPTSCINVYSTSGRSLRVVENVGLVYERGDTIWVARALNPDQLDYWDIPVIERFGAGSRLCKYDVTRTIDQSGFFSGVVFLDDFVPYTKVDEDDG